MLGSFDGSHISVSISGIDDDDDDDDDVKSSPDLPQVTVAALVVGRWFEQALVRVRRFGDHLRGLLHPRRLSRA